MYVYIQKILVTKQFIISISLILANFINKVNKVFLKHSYLCFITEFAIDLLRKYICNASHN